MFKLHKNNVIVFLVLCLLIIMFDIAIVQSSLMNIENGPTLTVGISLDFIVVIPLLLYFLIYRKMSKKIISILPVAIVGYFVLVSLIPDAHQESLHLVKYILIPLELLFVIWEINKMVQIIKNFKQNHSAHIHPLDSLHNSLDTVFKNRRLSSFLIHDLSVIYYAFLAWRKKPYTPAGHTSFSYHRKSGWLINILILSKILFIEGIYAHILLMQWSHPVAWILSLGNLYIILLFLADYRAMCLNPIIISKRELRVQYGIQFCSSVGIENMDSVSVIKFHKLSKEELKASVTPLVVEPNVLILLKSKITVTRLFGKRQHADHIYLFLDDPHDFLAECSRLLNDTGNTLRFGHDGS